MTAGFTPAALAAIATPMSAQLELSHDGGVTWEPSGDPRPCNVEVIEWEVPDEEREPVLVRYTLTNPGTGLALASAGAWLLRGGDVVTIRRPFGLVSCPA